MRRIFALVLAVLLIASAAYADSRVGDVKTLTATIGNDAETNYGHAHIVVGPCNVYRVTYSSNVANITVDMYDSASTGGADSDSLYLSALSAPKSGGNKRVMADLPIVAANTGYQITYDPPLKFEFGLLAGFGDTSGSGATLLSNTKAVATIEYN